MTQAASENIDSNQRMTRWKNLSIRISSWINFWVVPRSVLQGIGDIMPPLSVHARDRMRRETPTPQTPLPHCIERFFRYRPPNTTMLRDLAKNCQTVRKTSLDSWIWQSHYRPRSNRETYKRNFCQIKNVAVNLWQFWSIYRGLPRMRHCNTFLFGSFAPWASILRHLYPVEVLWCHFTLRYDFH